jgi:hypothetical protein
MAAASEMADTDGSPFVQRCEREREVNMKKALIVLLALFAVFSASVGSGVATADNGAQTVHFTAAYTDPFFGPVTCSGERIVKTAPKAFTKDSETCLIPNGFPAGTYTPADFGGWFSDYDGTFTTDVTVVVTDNGDGTSTSHIVAYY